MTEGAPLLIEAVVAASEEAAVEAAVAQLGDCLAAATGKTGRIDVRFHRSFGSLDRHRPPTATVVSLLPELARPAEPFASIETRWRLQLAGLGEARAASTFICTIFRAVRRVQAAHVADDTAALVERIRRLNMLAVELSHDTGVNVIDIDRIFAHLGAANLNCDHRLIGAPAEEAAGYAIVSALLGFALDDIVPSDVLRRAKELQGPIWELGRLVERRLARRRRQHVTG
jgi:hypothetical protein